MTRWPNSARGAWLEAKARREEQTEARRRARWENQRPRRPKPGPTPAQALHEEIQKLLVPIVQLEQMDVLQGVRDYLSAIRLSPTTPDPEPEAEPVEPPAPPDYSDDIPF